MCNKSLSFPSIPCVAITVVAVAVAAVVVIPLFSPQFPISNLAFAKIPFDLNSLAQRVNQITIFRFSQHCTVRIGSVGVPFAPIWYVHNVQCISMCVCVYNFFHAFAASLSHSFASVSIIDFVN